MRFNIRKALLGCFALAVLIYIFSTEYSYDFSQSAWSLPLSGKIIMVDPGHGGTDGGATSASGIVEKEVALVISLYLRDLLQQSGALVQMTREVDEELATEEERQMGQRKVGDLKKRVRMMNQSDVDFAISIHLNSIPSPRWRGAQTFFNPQLEENQQLALFVQDELIGNLENTNRQAKKNQDVFILRHSQVPTILVEVGFLSNPEEAALLNTVDYQKKVAASIYQGILRYYSGENIESSL